MAEVYKASCKCGYEIQLLTGMTRAMCRNKTYYSPVLCRECGKLNSSLFGGGAPTCKFCQSTNIVSYDDAELRVGTPEKYPDLTNGLYFCPQCKEFSLSFKDTGCIAC